MKALWGLLSVLVLAVPAYAADGDLCTNPVEVQGFKTCADVAKAEDRIAQEAANSVASLETYGRSRMDRDHFCLASRRAPRHCGRRGKPRLTFVSDGNPLRR